MISLHHTHLMASDIDATVAFWREAFDAELVADLEFAGARNVFMRIGRGRIHLYDQPPRGTGPSTVHHLGVETDAIDEIVDRLTRLGASVTEIRREPGAASAMAEAPDGVLIEIFQPDLAVIPPELHAYFDHDTTGMVSCEN